MNSDLVSLLRNPETPDYVIRDFLLEERGEPVANVYVVVGETGEYSDWWTWTVAAFLDESQANAMRDRLTDWMTNRGMDNPKYDWRKDGRPKPPDDPQFYCDYYKVRYHVQAISLRAE